MAWQSLNLGSVFGKQLAGANSQISSLNDTLDKLTENESEIDSAVSAAQSLVSSLEDYLESLSASGIYTLALEPAQGSWTSRTLNAVGAPARNASLACAIFANIMQASTLGAVQGAYAGMKSALLAEVKAPDPSTPQPQRPTRQAEGSASWVPENAWQSITLSKVVPAEETIARNQLNEANQLLSKALNAQNALRARKNAIQDAIDVATAAAAALTGNGTYTVQIAPATGDWYSRLTGESGGPSTDPNGYCAGTVTVIQASSLAEVTANWTKLMGAISV